MTTTHIAYMALIICLAGAAYRVIRWFRLPLGPESNTVESGRRFFAAARAMAASLLRPRDGFALLRVLLFEVLLQTHIFKQDARRWAMHMALFAGMVLLLLMHVCDDAITAHVFRDYAATRNPFLFLRNLLGVLVLAGVGIAWRRRRNDRVLRIATRSTDVWLLACLAGIIISGAALEATRIISPALFDQMVVDYMGSDDADEIAPLKALWAAEFDVVFTPAPPAGNPWMIAEGRGLHVEYCAECHSRPRSAVLSYPLALAIKPLSAGIERIRLENKLWYVHFFISCLALALLPFSKLFHLVATPVSLMIGALGKAADNRPVNRPTRRAITLDACTHCGVCTRHCAVAPIYRVIPNKTLLPSEKMKAVTSMAAGRIDPDACVQLAEGSFICTACGRCTRWCPSGIDLQDLWAASRKDIGSRGYPEPHVWMRRHDAHQWAEILQLTVQTPGGDADARQESLRLTDNPDTFWACVQCATCTNVCPVVAIRQDPQCELEMTPQQVMNLMRLRLKETAMSARMVWDCITCYKCQEHCPRGVRVADVLYELRNEACRRLTALSTGPASGTGIRPAPLSDPKGR